MSFGRCHLCQSFAELCDSHALPDAQFRPMLREGQGSAIAMVDDETTPIARTSDTWSTNQHCSPCESLLNEEYDCYGIAVFKGNKGRVQKGPAGVTILNVDSARLRMFLLSVLWRMATSPHESYLNARLPSNIAEELRTVLLARGRLSSSKLQVSLERLHDSSSTGGFSSEQFREIVMSPFVREHARYYTICFLMFGFLVQVFVPSLPLRSRRAVNIISTTSNRVFATRLDFSQFPEFMALGVRTIFKSQSGLSTVADA